MDLNEIPDSIDETPNENVVTDKDADDLIGRETIS